MATQDRRQFLRSVTALGAGVAGVSSLSSTAQASSEPDLSPDRLGVLVDTTVCVGCRRCEWTCREAHSLPAGSLESYDDHSVYQKPRRPNAGALTVVNKYQNPTQDASFVKVQCMHCDHPACASACIVGAFSKLPNGSVQWDGGKCIGCRYCMVACPFQIPSFDFDKAIEPEIRKCDFCISRTTVGDLPACVDICPVEALTYGKRSDLIQVAHARLKANPQRYANQVFGEEVIGGTSWMYLTSGDVAARAFPALGNKPAPGVSESIQHGIFAYFVPPIALYGLLGLVMWISKNREKQKEEA